ncbi:hypothetical protein M407DRAFT_3872 [Tulasnella calospora MUT 4182]|uniref:Uncharacterized protein n=1 Tax=Tulasnella calospora MUT 4182 TaxID=1051891 RepID=A0A0C3QLC8_9AGAM|nr:hypothetical protein M407DRAFT_3872 [Tulasnella calospora MUT 4182]
MLSKSLKLSFPREVEIIASTLQPASTIHSFTFSVPTSRDLTAPASASQLRASVFSTTTAASGTIGDRNSYLGQPGMGHGMHLGIPGGSHIGLPPPDIDLNTADPNATPKETMYHGVCLTVWSHADEERTAAIRRTLETAAYARSRTHKVSMSSMATSIAPSVATSTGRSTNGKSNRPRKRSMPWSGTEMDESETDAGAMTESEADFSGNADGAGASTLFLPQNTVFWLPYALTLVSRHPIYDLMRDYLTLSWARFSKDVQSHTLQIAKILEAPSPRAGDIVRLDAGASGEHLEVVCRFPGGLDFGRGLVDVNIAVSTLKYLVELRGWNGIAHHNVHARDAKIYLEDPGPWIIAMSTESRYCVRPSPEVCICDLDINYVNCPSPPPGAISVKLQREKFRKVLMGAFDQYFHPDHGVPSEFKEAFPAGRFRPLCKITSKRGSSVVAESIKAPEWWHQTRVVTAFDTVLKDRVKKPSFIKRISTLGLMGKRPAQLSPAERMIQASIRKRATAFVDARDDLETKIGRLSRRLNFLMTESELWRQKFVAFEGYAEKLSAEAGELRAKINKEQRETDFSGNADGAGASTLFLPQNTVFWLPYALTLVSRHPIYDLMRDYLTLSWARFSKDVQSHTLQIAKILEAPSPRAGDIVRLDAGASGEHLEVVCRFPGGLDFGRGLVDVNIAVSTLKYLVELRGWNGIAHHNVHARDAKIYLEDPGPWIIAMSTESRYCVRPSPEVCICDLDINYVNCPSPPPGAISVKLQREKFRKVLMGAFDQYFHPDHGVPSEFKEAFPAGRFRPLCKITSKRGSSVVAESIKAPEWWHQTRVVTAFDTVLKDRAKKPSFIKRISTLGLMGKRPAQLSPAERMIQASIRKRATAFVDARDDLETKIGRLSRRLNFLMTESELWRQKFVAFEGYAEKLSAEAGELRAKINKEQRESKRLSGLVGLAAHEKHMLQQRLVDTESKHKHAVVELERMKVEMEEMEEEREKMVADVEAQIERALASMTLSDHYERYEVASRERKQSSATRAEVLCNVLNARGQRDG